MMKCARCKGSFDQLTEHDPFFGDAICTDCRAEIDMLTAPPARQIGDILREDLGLPSLTDLIRSGALVPISPRDMMSGHRSMFPLPRDPTRNVLDLIAAAWNYDEGTSPWSSPTGRIRFPAIRKPTQTSTVPVEQRFEAKALFRDLLDRDQPFDEDVIADVLRRKGELWERLFFGSPPCESFSPTDESTIFREPVKAAEPESTPRKAPPGYLKHDKTKDHKRRRR